MDLKRNDPAKLGILFILALSILIVTLFCNWIGVSILWDDEYVTLAKTANILEDLGGFTEERSLEAAKLVIYLFLLICAITSAITIYSLFRALASETEPSEAGFIVPGILAILVILAVLVANAVLSRETGGWVDGAFSLAFSPFYVLGAGVLGTYLCRTLNILRQTIPTLWSGISAQCARRKSRRARSARPAAASWSMLRHFVTSAASLRRSAHFSAPNAEKTCGTSAKSCRRWMTSTAGPAARCSAKKRSKTMGWNIARSAAKRSRRTRLPAEFSRASAQAASTTVVWDIFAPSAGALCRRKFL